MPRRRKYHSRALVSGYVERISSKVFSDFPQELADLIGEQHGVYALYKGNRLYYVGLATDLRRRIPQHLKDKHKGQWDKFSLFLICKADHIGEPESLVIRMASPKGNTKKGSLKSAENLRKMLKAQVRKAQEAQIGDIFEDGNRPKAGRNKGRKGHRSVGSRGEPPLAPYAVNRLTLRATYKDRDYRAYVRKSGKVFFNGTLYNSPSEAGIAVVRGHCNGWWFWRFQNKAGEWVRLAELRK